MNQQSGTEDATDLVRPATLEELVERARSLAAGGTRRILGITGTPGAGKSTLSAALVAALGGDAVLVGMDGFHYAGRELRRLGRADRKGAPDTFDVDGYIALLERLATPAGRTVYAPFFDRSLEESIGSAVPVPPDVPLVVTEGNYLLCVEHGWAGVRDLLDEAWYVDVAPEVRRQRLVRRRESFGHSTEDSAAWVQNVDERNAAYVEASRERADLVVHVTTPL